eukprot:SAG22_NODE_4225_length_1336_cov_2.015360_1_plen_140_part_00
MRGFVAAAALLLQTASAVPLANENEYQTMTQGVVVTEGMSDSLYASMAEGIQAASTQLSAAGATTVTVEPVGSSTRRMQTGSTHLKITFQVRCQVTCDSVIDNMNSLDSTAHAAAVIAAINAAAPASFGGSVVRNSSGR